ncbi:uncharacterized protein [Aristolochia californica]|uniref:uncharacterized protein n=1 Tax=Aristolochia californica TaxID=171875 RepID=UPI0035E21A0C
MEMQIAGREKFEYIMGKTPFPQETDASYAKWYAENQKVKGWLLTSMSPDIMKRYIRLRTAREIWNALEKAFYDGIIMKDPDDVIAYRKSIEILRVHIFLNRLDAEFEQVRGEILKKDPILDLEEAYAYVRRDSVRRTTLNNEVDRVETSAMVARRGKPKIARPTGPNSDQNRTSGFHNRSYEVGTTKPERICTHYGETGHTKSRYYELIGYPEWWDPTKALRKRNSKSNNHASVVVAEPSTSHTTEDVSVLIVISGKVLNTFAPSRNSERIIELNLVLLII